MLFRGHCPSQVISALFGVNLTALVKKSGGIRPFAVDYFWRRLCAKYANNFTSQKLTIYFEPIQL